jgi:hypothetical protein
MECGGCYLLKVGADTCSACGGAPAPAGGREWAIEQALDRGATVAVLGAAASMRLQTAGGSGAWTRS